MTFADIDVMIGACVVQNASVYGHHEQLLAKAICAAIPTNI